MIEVVFSKTADRQVFDAVVRWSAHHPQRPNLLDDELQRAVALIREHPEIGPPARTRRFKRARVLVLQESGHLLVYRRVTKKRVRVVGLYASRATPERP